MSKWQPTEEEVAAGVRGMVGKNAVIEDWDEEIRAVLTAVGPAIAARALREAADDWSEYTHGDVCFRFAAEVARARADRTDPPSSTPDGKERG
jgi:hypothetical protein